MLDPTPVPYIVSVAIFAIAAVSIAWLALDLRQERSAHATTKRSEGKERAGRLMAEADLALTIDAFRAEVLRLPEQQVAYEVHQKGIALTGDALLPVAMRSLYPNDTFDGLPPKSKEAVRNRIWELIAERRYPPVRRN